MWKKEIKSLKKFQAYDAYVKSEKEKTDAYSKKQKELMDKVIKEIHILT